MRLSHYRTALLYKNVYIHIQQENLLIFQSLLLLCPTPLRWPLIPLFRSSLLTSVPFEFIWLLSLFIFLAEIFFSLLLCGADGNFASSSSAPHSADEHRLFERHGNASSAERIAAQLLAAHQWQDVCRPASALPGLGLYLHSLCLCDLGQLCERKAAHQYVGILSHLMKTMRLVWIRKRSQKWAVIFNGLDFDVIFYSTLMKKFVK